MVLHVNHFDKTMRSSIKTILAILTVFSMVLSGCTEASIDSAEIAFQFILDGEIYDAWEGDCN